MTPGLSRRRTRGHVVGNQHPPLARRKREYLRVGHSIQGSLLRNLEIDTLIAPKNTIHYGPFEIHIGEKEMDHRLLASR